MARKLYENKFLVFLQARHVHSRKKGTLAFYVCQCKASTRCGLGTEQFRPRDACLSAATTPCSESSPYHFLRIALFPLSIPHLSPSDRRLPSNSQDSALVASNFTLGSPKIDGRRIASCMLQPHKGSRCSQPSLVRLGSGSPRRFGRVYTVYRIAVVCFLFLFCPSDLVLSP